MQTSRGFWRRVADLYDRIKPAGAKAHNANQRYAHTLQLSKPTRIGRTLQLKSAIEIAVWRLWAIEILAIQVT
ncbi:hypothetical protein AAHA92_33651 [Salvia divinorum]|uniref:Uncharacterized protein n=1 Tax=Salvia divinorum TaxID=28513 RepID=A0ABD1FSC2_SALDI